MKDNTDACRNHSAVCGTLQMTPAAQASSVAEKATVNTMPTARPIRTRRQIVKEMIIAQREEAGEASRRPMQGSLTSKSVS